MGDSVEQFVGRARDVMASVGRDIESSPDAVVDAIVRRVIRGELPSEGEMPSDVSYLEHGAGYRPGLGAAVARPPRSRWPFAMALAMVALLAGCAGPGEDIANRIRDASLSYVDRVEVAAVNPMKLIHDDNVVVYLSGDVTDEQVRELWCTVVVPADPGRLGSGTLSLRKGATFGPQGDVTGGAPVNPPLCDGASSSP